MIVGYTIRLAASWFEAFDEDWKSYPDNPLGAEKLWGLDTIDRQPKAVISKAVELR